MNTDRNINSTKLGIIAEDNSDLACLGMLIRKILPDRNFVIRGHSTNGGCNMLNARKMQQWIISLKNSNCQYLIVVHDLDRDESTGTLNNESALRKSIADIMKNSKIGDNIIIIPIEEIEAWLLSDRFTNPQSIANPKSVLKKQYKDYRTAMNKKIAQHIDVNLIQQRCPSFRLLYDYILKT
jgi:hypothetical protein